MSFERGDKVRVIDYVKHEVENPIGLEGVVVNVGEASVYLQVDIDGDLWFFYPSEIEKINHKNCLT